MTIHNIFVLLYPIIIIIIIIIVIVIIIVLLFLFLLLLLLLLLIKSVAYCFQGSHTGQLDFCNWLADGSATG